jgi:hypothetical protein
MRHVSMLVALAASAPVLLLAACGSGISDSGTVSTSTPSSTVTCAQAGGTIQLLETAQQKFDASQQTVSDGVQYDVSLASAIAIINAERWPDTGTLGQDLHQFDSDANQYTSGDVSDQLTVATDVTALAADCGVIGGGAS